MFNFKALHNDESGQTALETAIILIAFVVVASVFAFTILSAGSSSTEKGEAAIYSGLENVQSSMAVKGAVIANSASDKVTKVVFTVALASGGDAIDLGDGTSSVVISYRDDDESITAAWAAKFLVNRGDEDAMLEDGELAEITVDLTDVSAAPTTAPGPNAEFTLEVKPPSGAVLNITRTTPAALDAVMELR
ncbi:archaellin/type IV pilin N-terminal domain-containing protein [Aggregatilinea lenta]|uniref:archaellin/type IV pilin N-terminal domain-containing protein n=1 Tax=Aggregatilinea lenta TaxID=913108 RepID=UPI000E5A25AA|nr:archaellin/type IV pilin N-terminal domain-containing protein [Aggregatilinea lenta]